MPEAQMPPAIRLTGLNKCYRLRKNRQGLGLGGALMERKGRGKPFFALQDIDLVVPKGEWLGILGLNGSGKSTLLKMIGGISEPTSGHVDVQGKVSSLIEVGAGFHPELSGYENVYLAGSIMGMTREQVEDCLPRIVEFAELEGFMEMAVKHYSSGMFVRLGFSVAIQMQPDILLLDEVLAVGDMAFQARAIQKIQEFQRAGVTILFVSHDPNDFRVFCDRLLWLDHGRVRALGDKKEVLDAYSQYLYYLSNNTRTQNPGLFGDLLYAGPLVDDPPLHILETDVEWLDDVSIQEDSCKRALRLRVRYRCTRAVEKARLCLALVRTADKQVAVERDSEREGVDLGSFDVGEGEIVHTMDASLFFAYEVMCIVAFFDPADASRIWARYVTTFSMECPLSPPQESMVYLGNPCTSIQHDKQDAPV